MTRNPSRSAALLRASALLALLLAALGGLCAAAGPRQTAKPRHQVLLEWMEGDFDNSKSLLDASQTEEHFPIEVHLRRLPAIENGLYIEQAVVGNAAAPYRQRVYIIAEEDGVVVSRIYLLKDEARFANAHLKPELLAEIDLDAIELKGGCEVYLEFDGTKFAGGTRGEGCVSALGGASYAKTTVTVDEGGFTSLDQGFDSEGKQVWGPEARPYDFRRASVAEPKGDKAAPEPTNEPKAEGGDGEKAGG